MKTRPHPTKAPPIKIIGGVNHFTSWAPVVKALFKIHLYRLYITRIVTEYHLNQLTILTMSFICLTGYHRWQEWSDIGQHNNLYRHHQCGRSQSRFHLYRVQGQYNRRHVVCKAWCVPSYWSLWSRSEYKWAYCLQLWVLCLQTLRKHN